MTRRTRQATRGAMAALLLFGVLGATMAAGAEAATLGHTEIKRLRKEAAHRPRRLIVNNDGGDAVVQCEERSIEAFLECRTTALAGTQVDTIFYCTSRGTFGVFSHKTAIGQTFTSTEDRFGNNLTGYLIEQGTDPLQVMIDFCRKHDIEIFWSMRMNDTHDSWGYRWEDLTTGKVKKEHPEWLVASKEKRPKVGGFKAVDYGVAEIRGLAFQYIEEVCTNYDIDGMELDFFRHPVFFKCHAWGQDCGQEELDKMTGLMRRVRTMADTAGAKRGRPILIAVRVPDSAEYCRAIGLDIEQWLEEDLIGLMTVAGYFRLNPWETSVELGHKYGVPVHACLSESRLKDPEAKKVRASVEGYRGRAMNAWDAGIDSIYLFNLFNPRSPIWREIGEPKTLRPLARVYSTGARGVNVIKSWLVDGKRFLNRAPLSPERPRRLKPGETTTVALRVGEALSKEEGCETALRLRVAELAEAGRLDVKLNGTALTKGALAAGWITYEVDPNLAKQGVNEVEIGLDAESASGIVVEDLLLWVRPEKDAEP